MKILSLFVLLFVIACAPSKEAKKNYAVEASNSITLERTACYGTCPVYQVSIFADGKIVYEGKQYVDHIGTYSAKIDKNVALALFAKISTFSWEAYPEKYPIDNYDFPQFHLEYQTNDLSKLIKANTNAPKELIALSKEMDKLVSSVNLKKD